MKKSFFILVLMILSVFAFAQKAGDKITFSGSDLKGNPVTSELFAENKVTMLNIWGTFCGPCIREMPDLAKLNEDNKHKDFEIVGIIIDILDQKGNVDPGIKANADLIISKTGADYTHIIPSEEMINEWLKDIQAVPTTIFVDSNGKQIGNAYVGSRSFKDWQKIINKILKK